MCKALHLLEVFLKIIPCMLKEGKKTKQKNPFICIEERWWNLGHICPVQFVSLVSKEKIVRVVCQQLPENVLIFTSLILIL